MNGELPPILVVDDEKNIRTSIQTMLQEESYSVQTVDSAEAGLKRLEQDEYFMIITDARLGGMTGYEFLKQVKARWSGLPVLMITAYATPKLAVEAIKSGAMDYLSKPFAPEELLHAVARCAERYKLLAENAALRSKSERGNELDQIIGECPKMVELRQLIRTVAPTNATVLILGESGTGKELIAGALHNLSSRSRRPYVRINCAAIPENLLESELFGHEKGSFTGAIKQKIGRVEEANGGTIFLDEIGDMSRPLQAKLLRFLEDGSFTRVGGNEERRVDVRLLAATNRDIIHEIEENNFREDLFHRLNVVQFSPPPLRERGGDVRLLAEHFLRQFGQTMNKSIKSVSAGARHKLANHHWPGNVRELRNVIERAVILETSAEIQASSLPDFYLETRLKKGEEGPGPQGDQTLDELMMQYEKDIIMRMLEQQRYNLGRTAEALKLSRHALRYRMQRLSINTDGDGDDEETASAGKDSNS
ncbi:MAG TPA: response regulator [Verrucomicrobiales bacterium]|nr:response regulator [Verrucomicrobiales bacterium]